MNTFRALALAALLANAAPAAAAVADSASTRAASAVGQWIAAQGNQALRDIREEMKDRLLERLRPVLGTAPSARDLPVPAAAAQPSLSAPSPAQR